jgi:lysozyme
MKETNLALLKAELKRDEGTGPMQNGRHMPYRDIKGITTIGYGRNLQYTGISPEEAEMLLDHDIARVHRECQDKLVWFDRLDDTRKRAVINLVFTMGMVTFRKFSRMNAALATRQWELAAEELQDSMYAEQVGARATRVAKMIAEGDSGVS